MMKLSTNLNAKRMITYDKISMISCIYNLIVLIGTFASNIVQYYSSCVFVASK